jgi:transcriptional regulator with XRE-family HTH domain
MNLKEIFISNLKKIRKERGMSQMTLSRLCDTTTNYIGQIEMGRRIPSFDKIEQIAAVLEIPANKLFECEEKEEKRDKPKAKLYLEKMPNKVRNEIIRHLVDSIKKEVDASFDPQNY